MPTAAQLFHRRGITAVNPETVPVRGADLGVFKLPGRAAGDAPLLVWVHGWGHSHANMLPLAQAMPGAARSVLLDLPGFGAAAPPPGPWGTADYADAVAAWLAAVAAPQCIWIGHSFGCRVGLQLAARHPELVDGLFLIAAAGLPPHRPLGRRVQVAARRWAFRAARAFVPEGPARDWLRARFGSADYQRAGPLRPILVKAVTEDLTEVARAVRCPAVLVVGDRDSETPPEMAARLNALMRGSRLVVLRGFDHWTVLTDGRHQIAQRLTEFVGQLT